MRNLRLVLLFSLVPMVGCGGEAFNDGDSQSTARTEEGLSGCHAQASSVIPASGSYYLTSFGFTPSDDGLMSCGTKTLHGTWYYAASRQRYGCGSHIKIEANGKCVVAKTDDYGPDVCVEAAAGRPIIDASPLVSEALFGTQSAGWSDRFAIQVTQVPTSTPLGPCTAAAPAPGDPAPAPTPTPTPTPTPAPAGPATCHSSTLDKTVASGTCVQSVSDGAWYKCTDGAWLAGNSGCTESFAYCHSSTLGKDVAARTCVQSRADSVWYQCGASSWETPVTNGAGPVGTCSVEYSL